MWRTVASPSGDEAVLPPSRLARETPNNSLLVSFLAGTLHSLDERRWHGRCLDASVGEGWGCAEGDQAKPVDGGGGPGEPRFARIGLRHPAAVVPAVSAPAAYTALDTLDTLDTLGTLDTLDTLGTLGTLGTLDTLDTLGTLGTLDTLDALDTFGTLDTLASERSVLGDAGRRERGRVPGL